jgi:4a-hydroxytetrahydrobiopterin dehydratase
VDIEKKLSALSNWTKIRESSSIQRKIKFKDFKEAWNFMNLVAEKAEDVYNRVEIILSTHDQGGITNLDIELAKFIDSIS